MSVASTSAAGDGGPPGGGPRRWRAAQKPKSPPTYYCSRCRYHQPCDEFFGAKNQRTALCRSCLFGERRKHAEKRESKRSREEEPSPGPQPSPAEGPRAVYPEIPLSPSPQYTPPFAGLDPTPGYMRHTNTSALRASLPSSGQPQPLGRGGLIARRSTPPAPPAFAQPNVPSAAGRLPNLRLTLLAELAIAQSNIPSAAGRFRPTPPAQPAVGQRHNHGQFAPITTGGPRQASPVPPDAETNQSAPPITPVTQSTPSQYTPSPSTVPVTPVSQSTPGPKSGTSVISLLNEDDRWFRCTRCKIGRPIKVLKHGSEKICIYCAESRPESDQERVWCWGRGGHSTNRGVTPKLDEEGQIVDKPFCRECRP